MLGPRPRGHPVGCLAQVAEAIGCRMALALLLELSPAARAARVVGDNLAVVRYGAGTARIRRAEIQSHLEISLSAAVAAGWRLSWQAVPRRLNGDADSLAAEARRWAANLQAEHVLQTQVTIDWLPAAAAYRPLPHLALLAIAPISGAQGRA